MNCNIVNSVKGCNGHGITVVKDKRRSNKEIPDRRKKEWLAIAGRFLVSMDFTFFLFSSFFPPQRFPPRWRGLDAGDAPAGGPSSPIV